MFALVDCNNFYVSCERVFNPKLKNIPVIVLSNNDGCVISRSDEVKKLGIKIGTPVFNIENILTKHNIAVFSSNYELYGDMSERVMNTLAELVKDIELYSIDEAFLDLSGYTKDLKLFATEIRNTLKQRTGIPVSIGIAPTKTLSKIASKIAKRNDGVFLLTEPEKIDKILAEFPVEDIWGIGERFAYFLKKFKIDTALKLKNTDEHFIRKYLTVVGLRTVKELKGIPCIKLEQNPSPKQNICTARSFGKMITDFEIISEAVANFTATCAYKLRKQKSCANILTVFLQTNIFREDMPQYSNLKTIKLPISTNITSTMVFYALNGLKLIYKENFQYKKAGVILSGIIPESQVQQNLFDVTDRTKSKVLMQTIDLINQKMGKDKVRYAIQGFDRKWKIRQEKLSPAYTTKWTDILKIKI